MKNKKIIRLTESDLHNIVRSSVKKILKEVKVDYGEHDSSSRNYEWDSNPNNDRGFNYDNSVEFSNSIKEDYIGFAQRLERLTKSEWRINPSSWYYSTHNDRGYDSYSENMGEKLVFTTEPKIQINNREEYAKLLDKIEKMANYFFNGNDAYVKEKDGTIVLTVTGYNPRYYNDKYLRGHKNSREISYGKDYAGYPFRNAKSSRVKGYNHPYPNPSNDGGNFKLANWERFRNGESPMTYDEWNNGGRNYDEDGEYEPREWWYGDDEY